MPHTGPSGRPGLAHQDKYTLASPLCKSPEQAGGRHGRQDAQHASWAREVSKGLPMLTATQTAYTTATDACRGTGAGRAGWHLSPASCSANCLGPRAPDTHRSLVSWGLRQGQARLASKAHPRPRSDKFTGLHTGPASQPLPGPQLPLAGAESTGWPGLCPLYPWADGVWGDREPAASWHGVRSWVSSCQPSGGWFSGG